MYEKINQVKNDLLSKLNLLHQSKVYIIFEILLFKNYISENIN